MSNSSASLSSGWHKSTGTTNRASATQCTDLVLPKRHIISVYYDDRILFVFGQQGRCYGKSGWQDGVGVEMSDVSYRSSTTSMFNRSLSQCSSFFFLEQSLQTKRNKMNNMRGKLRKQDERYERQTNGIPVPNLLLTVWKGRRKDMVQFVCTAIWVVSRVTCTKYNFSIHFQSSHSTEMLFTAAMLQDIYSVNEAFHIMEKRACTLRRHRSNGAMCDKHNEHSAFSPWFVSVDPSFFFLCHWEQLQYFCPAGTTVSEKLQLLMSVT